MPGVPVFAMVLVLMLLSPSVAASEIDHRYDLCRALVEPELDLARVEQALSDGASPNDTCPMIGWDRKPPLERQLVAPPLRSEGWLGSEARWEEEGKFPVAPVVLASGFHSEEAVRMLLDAGADSSSLSTEFDRAVSTGRLSWAGTLADVGAPRSVGRINPSFLSGPGITMLFEMEPDLTDAYVRRKEWGIFKRHPERLRRLLDAGMSPPGSGAVDYAVRRGDLDWAETLVGMGADRTLYAVPFGVLADPEALERLVALEMDTRDLKVLRSELRNALPRNPQLLDQLRMLGLHSLGFATAAVRYRDLDLLEALADAGLNLGGSGNGAGPSPLNTALERKEHEALELMLALGAQVGPDSRDHPIRWAARRSDPDVVVALVGAAAVEEQRDWWVRVAQIATEVERSELVRIALEPGRGAGADDLVESVREAVGNRDLDTLVLLVAGSADPVRAASEGLRLAAEMRFPDGVAVLLSSGADPNWPSEGDPVLHLALFGYGVDYDGAMAETVSLLLEAGADVDARTQTGSTVLHMCGRFDRGVAARELLLLGADTTPTDGRGRTPLEYALRERSWSVAAALLEGGARSEEWMVPFALYLGQWWESAAILATLMASDQGCEGACWRRSQRRAMGEWNYDFVIRGTHRRRARARGR